MFHTEVEAERFLAALRQLSLATLSAEQRETLITLFLSFERASAGQMEDVSAEMAKILKQSTMLQRHKMQKHTQRHTLKQQRAQQHPARSIAHSAAQHSTQHTACTPLAAQRSPLIPHRGARR